MSIEEEPMLKICIQLTPLAQYQDGRDVFTVQALQ